MSVVLYRQGKTHKVNGIDCEIKLIRPDLFNGTVEEGWYLSPEDIYEEKAEEAKEDPKAETKETEEINVLIKDDLTSLENIKVIAELDYSKMSNKQIRGHAKEANIENWDDARIKTLIRKLKAWQQAT